MNDYVVMDAETQKFADDPTVGGWNNVFGMEMSSAVTYDSKTDNYMFWDHLSRERLCGYLSGKIVITYNGIMFDSRLLLGNDRQIESNGATKNSKYGWYNLDIYVEIFRHLFNMDKNSYPELIEKMKKRKHVKGEYSLKNVCEATINHTKNGDGADAPLLFKQGRIVELFQYNLQDVRVLKELFLFVLKYKYIINGSYDIVKFK